MKILVTGGKGQLGRAVSQTGSASGHEIIALSSSIMDVTRYGDVIKALDEFQPQAVVHAAAYTNVDKAESDYDGAFRTNVVGTQNVAAACLNRNIKMVYVSTDYVFDGTATKPYLENDPVNPQSVYGRTKLIGEQLAARICPRLFTVRTAWLYGEGSNFVRTMLKMAEDRKPLRVVNDQTGSPTYTVDLAQSILRLLSTEGYGTYHMTNNGACTWYEFAKKIFFITNTDVEVIPVTTEEFVRPARRPKYSVLRNYMMEMTIGDSFRNWDEALQDYLTNS